MSKLLKAEILLEEARMDVEHGSYNEAVSASYFSLRLTAEHLIRGLMTTKDDKIANALYREIKRKCGEERAKRVKETYLFLYNERKKADHRPHLFTKDEARRILEISESLRREIVGCLTERGDLPTG